MNDAVANFTQAALDCWNKACEQWPDLAQHQAPTILWSLKGRRALGTARHDPKTGASTIRFHPQAARMNPEGYADTIPHEVAHIVCMVLWKNYTHNWRWQSVCRALGGNGQRTCQDAGFAGMRGMGPRVRVYGWKSATGIIWLRAKTHKDLTDSEWARKYLGVTAFVESQLVPADEAKILFRERFLRAA